MVEVIVAVVVILVLLTLSAMLVLPIVAMVRTRRIGELLARVDRLEREVRTLRQTTVPPAEAHAPTQPIAEAAMAEVLPVEPPVAEPRAEPAPPRAVEARPVPRTPDFDLEDWIGRRGLGWVAVILLLFATAFFLKYAFDNAWVGELGRVAIGVAAGMALCGAGYRYHRRGWRIFSQMLTAGGIVLLYLATYASFGYYHLLPRSHASLFLVALIAEAAAVAILYEAPAIAVMAVVAGLLNPVLLRSDQDQYRSLFIYLVLLNAGVTVLALFRHWRAVGTISLLGTQLLFWGWYQGRYHPEKLEAVLVFQGAIFGLFVAYGLLGHVARRRTADVEDLVRMGLNGFLVAVAAYVLLDDDYHVWMGSVAVALAAVYALLGWVVLWRRPDDQRQLLTVVAIALSFVAMVFPVQFGEVRGGWVSVGWAAEGTALVWFGLRIRSLGLRTFGVVFVVLAVGRLLTVDTPAYLSGEHPIMLVPFLHPYGLSALAVAACVWAAVLAGRQFRARLSAVDQVLLVLGAVMGTGLTWFLVSLESYVYSERLFDQQTAQTVLSAVWATYAAVLLAIGFRWRSAALRWSALGLFALTLGKVFLIDMDKVQGFYRVTAFFALAVMMAGAAWGYQKVQMGRQATRPQEVDDATV